MANRITKRVVTFRNPFRLDCLEDQHPAGEYTVETEEEQIDGEAFLAFRRVCTSLIIRPPSGKTGLPRRVIIDPADIEAAIADDGADIARAENEGMQKGRL
jgi:hypothetical protein